MPALASNLPSMDWKAPFHGRCAATSRPREGLARRHAGVRARHALVHMRPPSQSRIPKQEAPLGKTPVRGAAQRRAPLHRRRTRRPARRPARRARRPAAARPPARSRRQGRGPGARETRRRRLRLPAAGRRARRTPGGTRRCAARRRPSAAPRRGAAARWRARRCADSRAPSEVRGSAYVIARMARRERAAGVRTNPSSTRVAGIEYSA